MASPPKARFDGKTAIVTGAGAGIGAAIVRRLIGEGAKVLAVDILENPLEAVPEDASYERVDVTRFTEWERLVDHARTTYGSIDALFNNAAVTVGGRLHEYNEDDWDRLFAVVVKGTFLGCKAVLPMMVQQKRGAIVNTGSTVAFMANHFHPAYGSAKAAVVQLSRHVALDYGRYGIRCCAICPGPTLTPKTRRFYFNDDGDMNEMGEWMTHTIPLGRFATPDEIAAAAVFLASDDASFITGSALTADGGHSSHIGAMWPQHLLDSP